MPAGEPMEIEFRSAVTVELVRASASDADVIFGARVSTKGEQSLEDVGADPERSRGLIAYLMRARHGSPFEHNSMTFYVQAPIFVFREQMRHRIACITGDTLITCESGRNLDGSVRTVYQRTVREIYDSWNWAENDTSVVGRRGGVGQGRSPYRSTRRGLRVLNQETELYETGWMSNVWQAGRKEVFEVRTALGIVKASADHPFLTSDGWVKVCDLKRGMLLVASKNVGVGIGRQVPPALRRGIGVWTSMQRNALLGEGAACHECGDFFPAEELHLDHDVPVVTDLTLALDVKNLVSLCHPCHRVKTSGEQRLAVRKQRLGVKYTPLLGKPSIGERMTYDIEMGGDHHNYVANRLVVHNSYNEESGRYRQLRPVFYLPGPDRMLVQEGKPGHYDFAPGSPEQHKIVDEATRRACAVAYSAYLEMLDAGVAREVARIVLPLTIYSSMYVTMNARSLMNFLSLRTKREGSTFPSYPQREIEMVAEQMEAGFARLMPLTYEAFNTAGRVAP